MFICRKLNAFKILGQRSQLRKPSTDESSTSKGNQEYQMKGLIKKASTNTLNCFESIKNTSTKKENCYLWNKEGGSTKSLSHLRPELSHIGKSTNQGSSARIFLFKETTNQIEKFF